MLNCMSLKSRHSTTIVMCQNWSREWGDEDSRFEVVDLYTFVLFTITTFQLRLCIFQTGSTNIYYTTFVSLAWHTSLTLLVQYMSLLCPWHSSLLVHLSFCALTYFIETKRWKSVIYLECYIVHARFMALFSSYYCNEYFLHYKLKLSNVDQFLHQGLDAELMSIFFYIYFWKIGGVDCGLLHYWQMSCDQKPNMFKKRYINI